MILYIGKRGRDRWMSSPEKRSFLQIASRSLRPYPSVGMVVSVTNLRMIVWRICCDLLVALLEAIAKGLNHAIMIQKVTKAPA
jgi:hypothetical protein